MDGVTNLRVLKKSRKKPKPGDVFVVQLRDDEYIFGRVIAIDADVGFKTFGNVLLYFYRAFSGSKGDVPEIDCHELLIPPVITNRLGWVRGYFETVCHRALAPEDVLEKHCFYDMVFKKYVDEYGQELPQRMEPCGQDVLHSFRTIDDELSKALGIPTVPD